MSRTAGNLIWPVASRYFGRMYVTLGALRNQRKARPLKL